MSNTDLAETLDQDFEFPCDEYHNDSMEEPYLPGPVHLRILRSESKNVGRENVGTCDVRLCVVKMPRMHNITKFWALNSQMAWENERDFLRKAQPEHPNIVQYFKVLDEVIFMEHCPLGSLEHYLKPDVIVPLREWTFQLCSAIVYLHDLGYAHNQLFTCNILVAGGGSTLKVCDFDAVTPANIAGGGSYPMAPELSITQSQKPAEKVKDAEGHLADVYSFGLLIWFMQHGGREVPANLERDEERWVLGDRVKSHLELLNVDRLELADVMRACWAHYKSRSTSKMVMELLNAEFKHD